MPPARCSWSSSTTAPGWRCVRSMPITTRMIGAERCHSCKSTPPRARSSPACSMSIRNPKTCTPISTRWTCRSTSSTRRRCVRAPPRLIRSTPACARAALQVHVRNVSLSCAAVFDSLAAGAMIVFADRSIKPRGYPMSLSVESKVVSAARESVDVISSGAALGAEILNIDLKDIDAARFTALKRAWHDHQVLLVRGQTLSDQDLIAFSRRFGDLDWAPVQETGRRFVDGLPEIYIVSNVTVNGEPIGSLGAGEAVWHTDMSYLDIPPMASMLYALEVPPAGGNTSFSSMYAVYEGLPDELNGGVAN